MLKLTIPQRLEQEFATVESIWRSSAETRRVDALVLSWVKYEKQLRRLFCFLVFQHPQIDAAEIDEFIAIIADNRDLYPETFTVGIEALGTTSVRELLGPRYDELSKEIERIKKYRNKLIHGQITGQSIKSAQLERDVRSIVAWIDCLGAASESVFGYDGIKRNTYRSAKGTSNIVVKNYPFATPAELKEWISKLVKTAQKTLKAAQGKQ